MARRALLSAVLLAVASATVACSDDETTGPGVDLSGTYDLQQFTQPPNPTLGPPIATGTLVLTATNYQVQVNVQGSNPINDNGTYSVSGGQWQQTSSVSAIQSVGTYTLASGTLTVVATTQGITTTTVWQRR